MAICIAWEMSSLWKYDFASNTGAKHFCGSFFKINFLFEVKHTYGKMYKPKMYSSMKF